MNHETMTDDKVSPEEGIVRNTIEKMEGALFWIFGAPLIIGVAIYKEPSVWIGFLAGILFSVVIVKIASSYREMKSALGEYPQFTHLQKGNPLLRWLP